LLANGIRHPLKARLPIGGLPVAELGRILDLDEGLGRCERLAGRLCTRFELQTGDLLNLSGQIPEKGKTAFQGSFLIRAPLKQILFHHLIHSSIHSVTGIT
jgi:hypothetical protein